MNDVLVKNWNSVVGPDDHVYHLGDFCFGSVDKWNWCLEPGKLNGHIHLILGNHDPERVFREKVNIDRFDSIDFQHVLFIDGWTVYLNHFPFASFSNNYDIQVIQLLGHIHTSPTDNGDIMLQGNHLQWNQYDVGVDNNNYTPISWAQVKEKMKLDEYRDRNIEESKVKIKKLQNKN